MSQVLLLREGIPNLLPMQGRSAGVHTSTIITDLAIRLGYLSGKAELSTTWAQLGCALERSIIWAYEREFPGRYVQPGEQCLDRVYNTPDLADHNPLADPALTEEEFAILATVAYRPVPEEIKCSWMTSRHTPRDCDSCGLPTCKKYWRYERQLQAECKMPYFDTTVGKLNVTHVNGSGRGGEGPANKPWLLVYEQEEIDSNWQMLVSHAETMRCGECDGSGLNWNASRTVCWACVPCAGSGVKLTTEG